MKTNCVFCDKVDDDDVTVSRDGTVVSFEPLNPVTPGHRLFVPYVHAINAAESPKITGRVFEEASAYGRIQEFDFNLITSAGSSATQTVFHLHVHYVPRREGDGLHLPWTGQVK